MPEMKTPGVYIVEKNAFPNSVVEVATAVPAFVGHTQRADNQGKPLTLQPWRITSMAEYEKYFGGPPMPRFAIERADPAGPESFTVAGRHCVLTQADGPAGGRYLLHRSMLHFFQNGGGPCYVVSVGGYAKAIDAATLIQGIAALTQEQEPTLLVVPEAVLLSEANCIAVQQAMLNHCGGVMRSRMAIVDVWGGHRERKHPDGDVIEGFRAALGTDHLAFAAAYYPWVHTTLVQDRELSYAHVDKPGLLIELLRQELEQRAEGMRADRKAEELEAIGSIANTDAQWAARIKKRMDQPAIDAEVAWFKALLDQTLRLISPAYTAMVKGMAHHLNLMPPAAAMAGVYTMVDNARGVWKAPANVSLNGVVAPAVNLTVQEQEDLNVTPQGKSINAIRAFISEGVLVWGARTLDGNSLDWRYINVRRTAIMLEQSCMLAAKAMVFEPNVANTWVTVKSMLVNFLTGIWKRGGLAGATPEDAFSVHVGLGETMTPQDITDGILRVTVMVALSRPAEFIEITFQQQMQKA